MVRLQIKKTAFFFCKNVNIFTIFKVFFVFLRFCRPISTEMFSKCHKMQTFITNSTFNKFNKICSKSHHQFFNSCILRMLLFC